VIKGGAYVVCDVGAEAITPGEHLPDRHVCRQHPHLVSETQSQHHTISYAMKFAQLPLQHQRIVTLKHSLSCRSIDLQ